MPSRNTTVRVSPSARSIGTWNAAHGSSAAPMRPDSPARRSATGSQQVAVAADELGAVAGHAAGGLVLGVDVEEAHVVGVIAAVRVARGGGAVVLVVGDDVRRRLRPQAAQHPFDVAGGADAARPAGVVADRQHRELDRRVDARRTPSARCGCPARAARTCCSRSRGARRGAARRAVRVQRDAVRHPGDAGLLVAQVEASRRSGRTPGRCATASGAIRARSRPRCRPRRTRRSTVPKSGLAITLAHGAGVRTPAGGATTYSRPSLP